MDTASHYMAIFAERLEDIVKLELREEFEAEKKNWLTGGRIVSGGTTNNFSRTKLCFGPSRKKYMTSCFGLIFQCGKLSKAKQDLWLFSHCPPTHRADIDSKHSKKRGAFFAHSNWAQTTCRWLRTNSSFFDGFCSFFPVSRVFSLFRAATTSDSLFTHAVDRWPSGRRVSTAYW